MRDNQVPCGALFLWLWLLLGPFAVTTVADGSCKVVKDFDGRRRRDRRRQVESLMADTRARHHFAPLKIVHGS